MRIFLAIDISEEVRGELRRLVSELAPRAEDARWVDTGNLHLTLRFFGETREQVLEPLFDACAAEARRYEPLTLEFQGAGFFPNERRPRVLWVGVRRPPPELFALQASIEEVAKAHGARPEGRRFSPHLTLARFRAPRPQPRLSGLALELRDRTLGWSRVEELVMYQSVLHPGGAVYRALRRFPLRAGTPPRHEGDA